MPDILVVQMARLGDFLQTTPLLNGIKEECSENRVCVLIDSANTELAKKCGSVDEIISIDVDSIINEIKDNDDAEEVFKIIEKCCLNLSNRYFDVVVNLNFSRIAAILSNMPGSGKRYGYQLDNTGEKLEKDSWFVYFNNMVKHSPLAPFNLVDYFYYIFCKKNKQKKLSFKLSSSELNKAEEIFNEFDIGSANKVIAVHPGIRHKKRSWPIEYYAELISTYHNNENIEIILTGSKEDRCLADELLKRLPFSEDESTRIHDLTGKTNISETAAVLKRSDLLLCGDTGVMHLGTAVGVKILSLFIGPASVYNTGPYSQGDYILQTSHDCGPCAEDINCADKKCRYTITPEIVFNLSMNILFNTQDDISMPENIRLLTSGMDDWGVRYLPLNEPVVNIRSLMNRCYREMGKALILRDHDLNNTGNRQFYDHDVPVNSQQFISGIIKCGKVILNKAYLEKKWVCEDRVKPENDFWVPWIDAYLENSEYEKRNSREYVTALENGLKFMSQMNHEC